jgi:O-antigen/teichoic acid export membrane protein
LTTRTAAIGALALAASFAAGRPLARALALTDPNGLPLLALAVVTSLLYLIAHATLLGRLRWRAAVALPVALGVTRLAFSVLFVYAGYGAAGVCAGIAVSTFGCFLIAYVIAASGLPPSGRYRPLHIEEVGLAGAASAAFWFLVHVDTVYVNGQLPAIAKAGYAAASTLARPLVYFPAAVNQVLFPFLAAATTGRARRTLLAQMLMAAAAIDVVALVALEVAPRLILETTFGTAYGDASGTLTMIALVLAPYSLVNIVFFDTLARNDRALTWAIVAVAAAAGLLLLTVPPSLGGLFAILVCASLAVVATGIGRIWPTLFGAGEGAPR